MYSGTITNKDINFSTLQQKVPDLKREELFIGKGVAQVTILPFTAPWLSAYGACLIKITDIKRNPSGELEFQIGDENDVPYEDGNAWCKADEFYPEWPQ